MTVYLIIFIISVVLAQGISNENKARTHTSLNERRTSGLLKNDKFFVYVPLTSDKLDPTINIYSLKDGPVSQINNSIVSIPGVPDTYVPQFLNFPQGLQNDRFDQIWMIGGQVLRAANNAQLDSSNWTSQFVNDQYLKFDSSFIKLPNFENFPKGGFSQNIVNVNNNPVLYIIGGYTYSKNTKNSSISSCVFKYDFNTNYWSDLSKNSKSILPPIATHQTVHVENYLILIGGGSPNSTSTSFPQTVKAKDLLIDNPINKIYKFDLVTEIWSVITTKTNLDQNLYGNGVMYGASYSYYNGSIISYGSLFNLNTQSEVPQLATLDLNTWDWKWFQVKSETGVDNNLKLKFHQALIVNDQLVLFQGLSNQKSQTGPFVINLKKYQFQSFLNYSANHGTYGGLPTYVIAIISAASILSLILIAILICLYIRYKKKRSRQRAEEMDNNRVMQEIWAAEPAEIDGYVDENGNFEKFGANGTSILGNLTTSGDYPTDVTLTQDGLQNLSYFQHEIDLQDMSENNPYLKVKK